MDIIKTDEFNGSRYYAYRQLSNKNAIGERSNHIVLYHSLIDFKPTYLERYAHTMGKKTQIFPSNKIYWLCYALNDIVANTNIRNLRDVTAQMVYECCKRYANGIQSEKGDVVGRKQITVDEFVSTISHFFANLAAEKQTHIEVDDMLATSTVTGKRGRKIVYTPQIKVTAQSPNTHAVLRNIPEEAVEIVERVLYQYDRMCYGIWRLGTTSTLRCGELMQLTQPDSPLGKRIFISYAGVNIVGIEIDLSSEWEISSKKTDVGRIKIPRMHKLDPAFWSEFEGAYVEHLDYLQTCVCKEPNKPLFVNDHGWAMTRSNYTKRLNKIIKEYAIPQMRNSDSAVLQATAANLEVHNLGTHIMRHIATRRLARLPEMTDIRLMHARGDNDIESSHTYLIESGTIAEILPAVQSAAMRRMKWDMENRK